MLRKPLVFCHSARKQDEEREMRNEEVAGKLISFDKRKVTATSGHVDTCLIETARDQGVSSHAMTNHHTNHTDCRYSV